MAIEMVETTHDSFMTRQMLIFHALKMACGVVAPLMMAIAAM